MNNEIKIALTNLGAYNEGTLRFVWLSLPASEEEMEKAYEAIGIGEDDESGGVYEEVFITAYEAPFTIGEYDDIETLNEFAWELSDLSDEECDIIEAYCEAVNNDFTEAYNALNDCSWYPGQTLEDVAYDIIDECYNLPDFALRYFDYKAFARDLSFDGYYETRNGVLYVY